MTILNVVDGCLTHLSSQIRAIEMGATVDLVFQSVAGTEAVNASFGINLAMSAGSPRGGAGPQARHAGGRAADRP